MQRFVHRRQRGPVFGEASALGGAVPSGSTVSRTVGVGSDDSTAIRVRPTSTVDHLSTGIPLTPEREGSSLRGVRTD
jgi:hypothetical protein